MESPFLPTDVVGSTHTIQVKVEIPSPLDSTIITYDVVAGDWGPPAELIIRAELSIITFRKSLIKKEKFGGKNSVSMYSN